MSEEYTERQKLERWVSQWQVVGPILEEIRREALTRTDTQRSLLNLADAFESCRLNPRPSPTSGLVIQQELFRRLRSCRTLRPRR